MHRPRNGGPTRRTSRETSPGTGRSRRCGEGPNDDVRALFVGVYSRGTRGEDLERERLERYDPTDERLRRFRQ